MSARLEYYTKHFKSVEVNATFYHLLNPQTFENWQKRTPDGFQWTVKAYRYVTHIKWEEDFWRPLNNFKASLVLLKDKFGPILFQFPPTLPFNKEIFKIFCEFLEDGQRYAIESQHPSWLEEDALSTLKRHHIAWCISDTAGNILMQVPSRQILCIFTGMVLQKYMPLITQMMSFCVGRKR